MKAARRQVGGRTPGARKEDDGPPYYLLLPYPFCSLPGLIWMLYAYITNKNPPLHTTINNISPIHFLATTAAFFFSFLFLDTYITYINQGETYSPQIYYQQFQRKPTVLYNDIKRIPLTIGPLITSSVVFFFSYKKGIYTVVLKYAPCVSFKVQISNSLQFE